MASVEFGIVGFNVRSCGQATLSQPGANAPGVTTTSIGDGNGLTWEVDLERTLRSLARRDSQQAVTLQF
ncbi:MAG: hypothetical protein DWH81_15620 [Planctomycetota bacterium]|nr:MAG: hypothetical protein DWH81_15620 [Planctomycetota bacterium]